MKPQIIYHDHCTDGFGAAFAAWLKFGDDAEYLPMSYGETTAQWDKLKDVVYEGRDVYIVDFSLPQDLTLDVIKLANSFTWLDHHKTAFEMWLGALTESAVVDGRYERQEVSLSGTPVHVILDDNQSGALLAWEYFHPDTEVPLAIQHIDDRDRWQFKLDGSKEFHAALASYKPWTFEKWKAMFDCGAFGPDHSDTYKEMLLEGSAILRAHEQNVQSIVDAGRCKCIVQVPWQDPTSAGKCPKPGLATNCPPYAASDVGHELANQSGTFGLCWYMSRDGKVRCSLRSNGDYDVSAIAKYFGGGGHRNAAGFETDMATLMGWLST